MSDRQIIIESPLGGSIVQGRERTISVVSLNQEGLLPKRIYRLSFDVQLTSACPASDDAVKTTVKMAR